MEKNTDETQERPLKKLIAKLGLTQKQIAEKTGIPASSFSAYVAGQSIPRFDNAVALAKVLNVSLEELAQAMGLDVLDLSDEVHRPTPQELAEQFSLEELAEAIGLKTQKKDQKTKKSKDLVA